MREDKGIFYRIDWLMAGLYLALVLIGWLNIYAAVYDEAHHHIVDLSQKYGKQMIFIIAALLLALGILIIDPKFFSQFAWFIYGFFLFMLVIVIFSGREVAGSKGWFGFGGFGIQPAEFAKMATVLALARFLGSLDVSIIRTRNLAVAVAIILVPALIVLLQHDTGSAIVFLALVIVLYRAGLTGFIPLAFIVLPLLGILALLLPKLVLLGILFAVAAGFYFYSNRRFRTTTTILLIFLASAGFVFSVDYAVNHILEPHQRNRIHVLLGQDVDLKGAGYNVNQSLIAIGSGGLTGKGFLQGTQTKYNFVPEQSTDFIFCTIGEEWGFVGSAVVVVLYLILFVRLILAAERQRSRFSRFYGYGVASILFFHFAINIGMTLGMVPVIGIPLPFVSYGGSSLWAFTILLFIFIRQDSYRYELV
ncbi:MAG TPA: rod shape-determining protein RodA [Bacteroidales bacterium]|nr:rod shape-determining protein RodA [Bacteroidales bacterium]HPS63209.1 rod shape-determining protein RodA [Bacteroidales bacterium]